MELSIINNAKGFFYKMIDGFGSDPYELREHVLEVEKWANLMLKRYPEADPDVVMLSVWLHDSGYYPIQKEVDHAISGEQKAREFLKKENYPDDKALKVLRCVRSHRCRDVMPESLEEKIIAFVDSASHMTHPMYVYIAMAKTDYRAIDKLERDYRDLSFFPEIKKELFPLYEAWKNLLQVYEKINLS